MNNEVVKWKFGIRAH